MQGVSCWHGRNLIHVRYSALHVDGPQKPFVRHARHVIGIMSFGNALPHVQQVFKHLLHTANIVADLDGHDVKVPYPLAFLAGFTLGWVRLRRHHRVSLAQMTVGWNTSQLLHITDLNASNGGLIQRL